MENLKERSEHWSKQYSFRDKFHKTLIDDPDIVEMFSGKSVLEIGPGNGRIYKKLSEVVSSYSIADICNNVLELEIYSNVRSKINIKSYNTKFTTKYDVIHCWYVVHHILPNELTDFFKMIHDNLNYDGRFIFNYPIVDKFIKPRFDKLKNDGMMTSDTSTKEIESEITKFFAIERTSDWKCYRSVVTRPIHEQEH